MLRTFIVDESFGGPFAKINNIIIEKVILEVRPNAVCAVYDKREFVSAMKDALTGSVEAVHSAPDYLQKSMIDLAGKSLSQTINLKFGRF